MHAVAREEVLLDLVGDHAKAGFFDGQPREGLGVRPHGGGHLIHDGVDLDLREFSQHRLRGFCAARERARLGDGGEITIGGWVGRSRDGHGPGRGARGGGLRD